MDPITIFGAAAAAAGLIQQGAVITKFLYDLCAKMKEAPETIRKQTAQIEQLLNLSRLFLEHTSLQEDSIASILGSCLLRALEFHKYLEKISPSGSTSHIKKWIRKIKGSI